MKYHKFVWMFILLIYGMSISLFAAAPNSGPLYLLSGGEIIPGGDARFPTPSQVAALIGTSGTLPSGSNKFVDNADQRLSAMVTPTALSGSSQITCTKPTQYIEGSNGTVILTDPAWLMPGTFVGQRCSLRGSSNLFTVTGPSTATVNLCGGIGSVVIGRLHASPDFTWTGSMWQQDGCGTAQQALNSGAKILYGFTEASPLQVRGSDGAGGPSTNGFDIYENASGNPIIKGICLGVPCVNHTIGPLAIGGKFHVQNNAEVDILSVLEDGTVSGLSAGPAILAAHQGDVTTACNSGGIITYLYPMGRSSNGTETAVMMPSPRAGNIAKLYVKLESGVPAGQTAVFTVRKSAAGTAVTCTAAAGQAECENIVSTTPVALKNPITIETVCSGGTVSLPPHGVAFVIE